jgi:hypothetical protein
MSKAFKSAVNIPTGSVGGLIVSSSGINNQGSASSYVGIQSASTASYAFFAGGQNSSGSAAPFYVTPAGTLTANSASISGVVNFTSGNIGPFVISLLSLTSASGAITASNATFTGNLTASAGKVYLPAAASAGGYQIFYGNYDNNYIALGASALQNWVNGNYGTYSIVLGYQAFANLSANNGGDSVVIGNQALYSASTVGTSQNVAVGNLSMTGNTAVGINTLDIVNSTALGYKSMYLAKGSIQFATAVGTQSMQSASGGSGNTAVGSQTMSSINGGNYNTALGSNSGKVTSVGSYNLSLGYNVYPSTASLSGTVQIGTDSGGVAATATASNQIVLGTVNHTTYIPGFLNTASIINTGSLNLPVTTGRIPSVTGYSASATNFSSVTTAGITPAGFGTFSLISGRLYEYKIIIFYQSSTAAMAVKSYLTYPTLTRGSARVTATTGTNFYSNATTNSITGTSATLTPTVVGTVGTTSTNMIEGILLPSANGTFIYQAGPSIAGTASIMVGSYMTVTEIG